MTSFSEFDRSFQEARGRASPNPGPKRLNGRTENKSASKNQFSAFVTTATLWRCTSFGITGPVNTKPTGFPQPWRRGCLQTRPSRHRIQTGQTAFRTSRLLARCIHICPISPPSSCSRMCTDVTTSSAFSTVIATSSPRRRRMIGPKTGAE
jgi:hypothetical protein